MSTLSDPVKGACLCGAVQYQLHNGYGNRVLCHCNSCRKTSGSTFMTNSFCEEKNLTVTAGETVKTYRDTSPDSGNYIDRSFCSACGSPLFARNADLFPGYVIIAMGSMEGVQGEGVPPEREWKPQLEYFVKRKAHWYANEGTELKHAGA